MYVNWTNLTNTGITGNKLEIVNITRHCGATYRCIVQNSKGTTHLDFILVVQCKWLKNNTFDVIFT